MADEKLMVSTNVLNAALAKQITKRESAPPPSPEAMQNHIAVASAPVASPAPSGDGLTSFVAMWKAYYPRIVSLLGWASWVMPAPALTVIKSLLAVVNNQIIPILEKFEQA